MPERDGSELFGPGNTWWDVRRYVFRFTRRTWPGLRVEFIEDAVDEGLIRTMDLWVHWKGSVRPDDPGLTFAGAKRHAAMAAHKYIKSERRRHSVELPLQGNEQSPADRALTHAASAVIEELQADERNWNEWARDLLHGLTEREAGELAGVSHQAIHKRRVSGIDRITPLLRKHGLVKGAA